MTASVGGLIQEARKLDDEVRRRKGEIRLHRRAIQALRDRQTEIERQCARLGITVTYQHNTQPGEGDHPWPQQNRSSTFRR